MSPKMNLLQCLTVVLPVVLLWSVSLRAQAQAIAKCWVFSPVVDEATIQTDVSTVETREPGTGRKLWSVSARLTWRRPQTLQSDGAYAISVLRMPSFDQPRLCQMEASEAITRTEEYTFTGLDFGFLYEFTVFVINDTNKAKSLVGITKGFGTPDCFQATNDQDFCRNAEVQYAGAPIQPRLDTQCRQEAGSSTITAYLSWDPPIQVNGDITAYLARYNDPSSPLGTPPEVVTVMEDPAFSRERVDAILENMTPGTSYTVLISAFVLSQGEVEFNEGLQVELKFRIERNPARVPICPTVPPTSPHAQTTSSILTKQPIKQSPARAKETSPLTNEDPLTSAAPPEAITTALPHKPTTIATSKLRPLKPTARIPGDRRTPTPTTECATTTVAEVEEKPVASSKKAGVAVAACLVTLGIVFAVAMVVLHFIRRGMSGSKPAASRPDTQGALKGQKTNASMA